MDLLCAIMKTAEADSLPVFEILRIERGEGFETGHYLTL